MVEDVILCAVLVHWGDDYRWVLLTFRGTSSLIRLSFSRAPTLLPPEYFIRIVIFIVHVRVLASLRPVTLPKPSKILVIILLLCLHYLQ
jgi:hypothetical protein